MSSFISSVWVEGLGRSSRVQTGSLTFGKTHDPLMVLQMFMEGRVSGEI